MSRRALQHPFLASLLLLAGCISLSKDFVEKRFYLLEASREGATGAPLADAVLSVRAFTGGPGLQGPRLVYRVAEARFEADYYHEFFVPPADFVTSALRRWMADAGLFRVVLEPGSLAEADYVLEGSLTQLFGDDRGRRSFAVLEIQVFLTRTQIGGPEVVFHRGYAEREPLESRNPEELVAAMNRALTRVLKACEADLAAYLRAQE